MGEEDEEEFEDDFEEDASVGGGSAMSSPDGKSGKSLQKLPTEDEGNEDAFENDFEEDSKDESKAFDDEGFEAESNAPDSPTSPVRPVVKVDAPPDLDDSSASPFASPVAKASESVDESKSLDDTFEDPESPVSPAPASPDPASPAFVSPEEASPAPVSPGSAGRSRPGSTRSGGSGSARPKSKAFDRIKQRAETDKQTNMETLEAAQAAGTASEMSISAAITSDSAPAEASPAEAGPTSPSAEADGALPATPGSRKSSRSSARPKSKAFDRIKERAETDKQNNMETLEAAQAAGTAAEMSISGVITSDAPPNEASPAAGSTERKLQFADEPDSPEDGSQQSPPRSIERKVTGYVKPGELPADDADEEQDDVEGAVRFEEPADGSTPPSAANRRRVRKPTGAVKDGALPLEEEEDADDSERKLRFDDSAVEADPSIERKPRRTPTKFEKPKDGASPLEEEEEEEDADDGERRLRFDSSAVDADDSIERKPRRTPTKFEKPRVMPLDTEAEVYEANRERSKEQKLNDSGAPLVEEISGPEMQAAPRPITPPDILNEGEEGEDDDPSDEDLQKAPMLRSFGGTEPFGDEMVMKKSASASFAGSLAVARRQNKIPSHLEPKRKRPKKLPPPLTAWDERHHLAGGENEMLPQKMRQYFKPSGNMARLGPEEHAELKAEYAARSVMAGKALKRLEAEEDKYTQPLANSADCGPPVIPTKHCVGGDNKNRDGVEMPWNNRWSQGIGILNEGVHALHREYFAQTSLFADAPSQRWRRYADVETAQKKGKGTSGDWLPIKENRTPRFPPIGV